jgi:hypothetical protein
MKFQQKSVPLFFYCFSFLPFGADSIGGYYAILGDGGSTIAGTLKYLSEVVSRLWISALKRSYQEFDMRVPLHIMRLRHTH